METKVAQIVWALIHEDEGPRGRTYGISFPDFPGCVSAGETVDEAILRGRETLAFHIEGIIEDGESIPQLRTLDELRMDRDFKAEARDVKRVCVVEVPFDLPGKPVRVNISIDERLLNAIDRAAGTAGQTRSSFIADAARTRIKGAA
ncbi:MAG: type II toxin-antitoxin system HicB family antitoxin [Alphaproteobacteria bacterium]|nr:type II toxin-antitoxin system HicB family antitoxin [Alphaproteobacteria bacterium]